MSRWLWAALVAIGAACALWWMVGRPSQSDDAVPAPPVKTVSTSSSPCRDVAFDNASFTVCKADPAATNTRLALTDANGTALRSLYALEASMTESTPPLFAMNAGMYDEEGQPIGLYIADGIETKALNRNPGEGNFHMLPNGVFWSGADGRYHVDTSAAFAKLRGKAKPVLATQSGPMLVINGALHPQITADGPSRYVRNGVGIDKQGTAWFAISNEPVSFGKFARLFRDELDCPNALYFDGSVSALWIPATERMDLGAKIGPMIVIDARPR